MPTTLTESWARRASSPAASNAAPASWSRAHSNSHATWICRYDYILTGGVAIAIALWTATGIPITPLRPWIPTVLRDYAFWTLICLMLLAGARVLRGALRFGRLRKRLVIAVASRFVGPNTLGRSARFLISLVLVLTIYSSIKQAIPLVNPARWDARLMTIETWLHAGWNPAWGLSRLEWPAWWLILLDYAYYLWFPLLPLTGAYFLSRRDPIRREHYLAAFAFLWIAAVVIALAIPSHGPCYVDPDRFPPPAMVMCRATQDWLWESYIALDEISLLGNGGMVFGCGLVALPSLHVAVCCLYAIFLWRENPLLRWLSIAYAALIFWGSVQSGWHYALDGYAGLLLAIVATWCTGRLASLIRPPRP